MPSIVNGLFSGRAGISSHGTAIAVVGDNISNASTIGFKSSRSEFQDLIAGGRTAGKTVGSGSSISAVNSVFEQGTLEFTNRPLDLAIDGNGLFVLENNGQRFYTRAGNFSVNAEGFIVNQNGFQVLGFPSNGSGALEPVSINNVSQDSVGTSEASIVGNLNASDEITPAATIPTVQPANGSPWTNALTPQQTTYADLADEAEYSTVVDVFDSLGAAHTVTFFFFHTASNEYQVRGYVNSEEVDTSGGLSGFPRQIFTGATSSVRLDFNPDGTLDAAGSLPVGATYSPSITWNNGSNPSIIEMDFSGFTQFSSESNILSISQNGKGIGTVGNVSIEKNGEIFALLSNGQAAVIGTIGLVNFSNPEGLVRIGGTLLQQSPRSGEPVVGRPSSGTFGSVQAGSLELSTVDIADQFVKLITLQRGFQANSRIITTVNQLLQEIIQLA